MLRRPSFISLVIAGILPPCAALEWKSRSLEFTTAPFQTAQEAEFHFANTSGKPVRILGVESNCDCLAAKADQAVYAPGASGTVSTRFTIGDRVGLYERRIKVVTDEGHAPVHLLLRLMVPELVVLTPRNVAWKLHEPIVEKSAELTPIPGLMIDITGVQSTNDDFTARLETIEAGRRYRVWIKPRDTTRPANAAFRLHGRAKTGQEVMVSVYGNVR